MVGERLTLLPDRPDHLAKNPACQLPVLDFIRGDGLRLALRRSKLHAEFWTQYGGELPLSDEPIKTTLLRQKGFNVRAVDDFIMQMRATFAFANLTSDDTIPCADGEVQVMQPPPAARGNQFMQTQKPPVSGTASVHQSPSWGQSGHGSAMRELPVTLPSSLAVATFKVPADGMTEVDFQTLVNSLTAMKPALVRPPASGNDVIAFGQPAK